MRKLIALIPTHGKSKKEVAEEAVRILKEKGIIKDGEGKVNQPKQDNNETKKQQSN